MADFVVLDSDKGMACIIGYVGKFFNDRVSNNGSPYYTFSVNTYKLGPDGKTLKDESGKKTMLYHQVSAWGDAIEVAKQLEARQLVCVAGPGKLATDNKSGEEIIQMSAWHIGLVLQRQANPGRSETLPPRGQEKESYEIPF